jgi:hypothetical protein
MILFLYQNDHLNSLLLGAVARSWSFPQLLCNIRCQGCKRSRRDTFRVWLRANGKSFPAAELTSRADILRGSWAGICQLTDVDYDGVPPLEYPQRVECTVVDMRSEWTVVVDVRTI